MKALFDIFNEKIIVLSSQSSVIKFTMNERKTFLDPLEAHSRGRWEYKNFLFKFITTPPPSPTPEYEKGGEGIIKRAERGGRNLGKNVTFAISDF